MSDLLLPHYERELAFLRELSGEFAQRYPKVAARLLMSGETCEDPHVERMIESFAFLAARIHKRIDDGYPEVAQSLLQSLYPDYLRPFPSASIAQASLDSGRDKGGSVVRIARGSQYSTRPVKGVTCHFMTCYDLELAPVMVSRAEFDPQPAQERYGPGSDLLAGVVRLTLGSTDATFDLRALDSLRLFLDGDASLVSVLREALLQHAREVLVLRAGSVVARLPATLVRPVGFASEHALLQADARTHPAYRLLIEYFAFPDKFDFVEFDLRTVFAALPGGATRELELAVCISASGRRDSGPSSLERLSAKHLQLFCTPVVNLFPMAAEPIRLNHRQSEYPLLVDTRRASAFEIHSVRRVCRMAAAEDGAADDVETLRPLYAMRYGEHERDVACWHLRLGESLTERWQSPRIAILDSQSTPRDAAQILSVELMCTNGELPAQLPFGLVDGDLGQSETETRPLRFLRRPTPSRRFVRQAGDSWRLVSLLALNQLSLTDSGGDVLREALALHDFADTGASRRRIEAVGRVSQQPAIARLRGNPHPVFVRGIEISVEIDETAFVGSGAFLFAQVLERFLAEYVQLNSFSRLSLVSRDNGALLVACPARSGDAILG